MVRYVILMLIFLLPGQVLGNQKEYIHAVTPFPPYFIAQKDSVDGNLGFAREVMDLIYKHANLNFRWVETPHARTRVSMEKGTVDAANWGESPEVDKFCLYPMPAVPLIVNVYAKKGTKFMPKSLEEFKGKTVGIVRGWPLMAYEALHNKDSGVKVNPVKGVKAAVNMLLLGRIEYLVVMDDPINELEQSLQDQLQFEQLSIVKAHYAAISKTSPNGQFLYDTIKKTYEELLESGALVSKNFNVKVNKNFSK